jgi:hypothetical protein
MTGGRRGVKSKAQSRGRALEAPGYRAQTHEGEWPKAREVAKMYGITERSLWRNLRWAAEIEAEHSGS